MENHKQELSDNIVESIVNSSIVNLAGDFTEFSIDKTLDEGLLKDIPWVGWIFKAKKTYITLSDRILLSKIVKFLISLGDIPQGKKEEFSNKIKNDKKFREKVGSTLFIILDKLDDLEKPFILSQIFTSYLKGYISFNDFHRLSDALSIAFIEDLRKLGKTSKSLEGLDLERLYRSGLAQIVRHNTFETRIGHSEFYISFELSRLGGLLEDILIGRIEERIKLGE